MAAYTLTLSISSDSPNEMANTVSALEKSLSTLTQRRGGSVISLPRASLNGDTGATAWYAEHAGAFLDELTPDAARAVLFVAGHAPTVSIETLSRELKMGTGPALAGKLASIGWAVRRLSAPPPFRRVRERYEIEPEVAAALLAARPEAVRPTVLRSKVVGRKAPAPRRASGSSTRVASRG